MKFRLSSLYKLTARHGQYVIKKRHLQNSSAHKKPGLNCKAKMIV